MTGSTSYPATASTQIHTFLRTGILSGEFAPGDPLPSERALSEQMGVGRHVVREAIKRLQQAGLVEVAQGGATRVRDWRTAGGLDVLADLARAGLSAEDWDHMRLLLRSMTEMRASIGADAARLAATRASDAQRAEIRYRAALVIEPESTGLERIERYEVLWGAILDASENLAYRLAYNSLILVRQGGLDIGVYDSEFEEPVRITAVTDAVASGEADRAYALAGTLLNRTVAALAGS